ncbi:unnamed protein product [Mytilus coruscus]|uniref:Uncharacterized protein n=1 Tax=Mytilus coruscus TaxID=42192 RepID=A0A6J8D819_MYTCO|nr:unnamed protein product [Mytilus coruscus]
MYTINADDVHRVHSLTAHIPEGDRKLLPIANLLENTIGSIERMRYPVFCAIPAELYEKEDAQKALDFTEQLINEVKHKYIDTLLELVQWQIFDNDITIYLNVSPNDKETQTNNGCPVLPPCTCQSIVIFCANLNLTSVPHFSNPVGNGSGWDLELHDNEITQIRYGDFNNLKLRKLFISNNKINVIENGALTGSEDSLLVLHLSNNKLTSIPSDVGRLKHLTDLDIHDNPMENMNEDIVRNISGSLLSLSLGNDIMTSWPQCLECLTQLTSMSIFSLNIPKIPDDAFSNYSHLNILEIISTNLSSIPTSIEKLINLENVNFYNNLNLTDESFPPHIFRKLDNLTSISIVNCSLRSLLLIFSEIPSLSFLDIENNPISYVEDGVFDRNVSKVWFMALKTTKLMSIPRTISNLTGLTISKFDEWSYKRNKGKGFPKFKEA